MPKTHLESKSYDSGIHLFLLSLEQLKLSEGDIEILGSLGGVAEDIQVYIEAGLEFFRKREDLKLEAPERLVAYLLFGHFYLLGQLRIDGGMKVVWKPIKDRNGAITGTKGDNVDKSASPYREVEAVRREINALVGGFKTVGLNLWVKDTKGPTTMDKAHKHGYTLFNLVIGAALIVFLKVMGVKTNKEIYDTWPSFVVQSFGPKLTAIASSIATETQHTPQSKISIARCMWTFKNNQADSLELYAYGQVMSRMPGVAAPTQMRAAGSVVSRYIQQRGIPGLLKSMGIASAAELACQEASIDDWFHVLQTIRSSKNAIILSCVKPSRVEKKSGGSISTERD